jgi:hypothetical protein
MAGALLDSAYRAEVTAGPVWFAREQARVHRRINRVWPRALGTTPMGMARAITAPGVRYRWRPCRSLWRGRDAMVDVLAAVAQDRPVAMLVGNVIPRHWVLIVEAAGDRLRCYEPSSGGVRESSVTAVRTSRLVGLGFPRAFAFVVPRESNSNI